MTAAAAKVKAKLRTQPVYLRMEKLVRPETGELVRGFVALTEWDRRAFKERKYHVGTEVRAELKKPRDIVQHRRSHAIANLVIENFEGFPNDAHATLKQLQRESGVFCDITEYKDVDGNKFQVKEAQSLSFDSMEQGDFEKFYKGICQHICNEYWPHMTPEEVEVMADAMGDP